MKDMENWNSYTDGENSGILHFIVLYFVALPRYWFFLGGFVFFFFKSNWRFVAILHQGNLSATFPTALVFNWCMHTGFLD